MHGEQLFVHPLLTLLFVLLTVCGISLAVSFVVSILLCFTCDLVGGCFTIYRMKAYLSLLTNLVIRFFFSAAWVSYWSWRSPFLAQSGGSPLLLSLIRLER